MFRVVLSHIKRYDRIEKETKIFVIIEYNWLHVLMLIFCKNLFESLYIIRIILMSL